MGDWHLVHESKGESGSSKIYQDSKGDVRIDSYNGDVRDSAGHDRFTLNTRDGGNVSGHGYDHSDKFDSSKSK